MEIEKMLVTANEDEASGFIHQIKEQEIRPVHIPLESYTFGVDDQEMESLLKSMSQFRFVVCRGLRNTRYYLRLVEKSGHSDSFRQLVHLVPDRPEARLLEDSGIPAVMPREGGAAIDMMEFLLGIRAEGALLYPCSEESSEDLPGLLEEMEMPYRELHVCRPVSLKPDELDKARKRYQKEKPDAVLFHSRGSFVRTVTAFPELDLDKLKVIAASRGVAWKLRKEGVEPKITARGSWTSLLQVIGNRDES